MVRRIYTIDSVKEFVIENSNCILLSEEYNNTKEKMWFQCHCGEKFQTTFEIFKGRKNSKQCPPKRQCNKCGYEITKQKQKFTYDDVFKIIKQYECELISNKYINNRNSLKIKCKCGESFLRTLRDFRSGKTCCFKCSLKNRSGFNHFNWKGGISPLQHYMRDKTKKWRKESFKFYGRKCHITGEYSKDLVVHHTYGFSTILNETLNELNLPKHYEINQYTEKEIKSISKLLVKNHYKYGLGIPLKPEIHEEFHNIYGRGNNTPEQFEEFKQRYFLEYSMIT